MINVITYYSVRQWSAVREFAGRQGATILRDYMEVESGKRSDRPVLAKTIAHAKLAKATLVVAKLDRLAMAIGLAEKINGAGCKPR